MKLYIYMDQKHLLKWHKHTKHISTHFLLVHVSIMRILQYRVLIILTPYSDCIHRQKGETLKFYVQKFSKTINCTNLSNWENEMLSEDKLCRMISNYLNITTKGVRCDNIMVDSIHFNLRVSVFEQVNGEYTSTEYSVCQNWCSNDAVYRLFVNIQYFVLSLILLKGWGEERDNLSCMFLIHWWDLYCHMYVGT